MFSTRALALAAFAAAALTLRAPAIAATALSGVVYSETHALVAGARVTLEGNNVSLVQTTDAAGRFTFGGLNVGTYHLLAETKTGAVRADVDLGSGEQHVTLTLLHTVALVKTSTLPPTHGSGTDLTINAQYLQRSPASKSFPSLLLQVPGAARGANGVVHINGDHGDINYVVDGVPIPQELNRQVGSEFDPADVSFVEVLQGAYPAQYGERFAAVVNVNTRVGTGSPGFDGDTTYGSFGHADGSIGYHGRLAGGAFVANLRAERSDRFLDPPTTDNPHDQGSNTNAFFRYTKNHGNDFWNLTLSNALQHFQIPNGTQDAEAQNDLFGALQFHHALHDGGSLSYGLGYKRSQIRDLPDKAGDFTVDAYSLFADRTSRDLSFNLDDDVLSAKHDVRFGATYGATTVQKRYDVTLQSNVTVRDDAPNVAHEQYAYVQDSWKMGRLYQLDYGLRSDQFQLFSTEFRRGFAQLSPRIKLTRNFGTRANVYAYYGRFFTPFSFENVSPSAAQQINAQVQPTIAQFDLLPERDSTYELGGHLPLGAGQLGLRVMQKNATDLIDDTQVGQTALHQDINYAQGRIAVQTAYYQQSLARGGRFYASLSHTRAFNRGCETQLLAPCFGAPSDWTQADHDQRWDATAGALWNDRNNGWLSLNGEYGSGLSSAMCGATVADCKVPPHLTFDAEKGYELRGGTVLTLTVRNLLNDRYRVTYLNAQGDHYAAPRTIELGLQFGKH